MEQFYEQINEANALIEAITFPQTSTSSREFYFDDLVWSNILSFIKIYKKRNLKFSELKLNEWYKVGFKRTFQTSPTTFDVGYFADDVQYTMVLFKDITPKYVTFDYKRVGYVGHYHERGTSLKRKIIESRIPYVKENGYDYGLMPVEKISSTGNQYHPGFYFEAIQLVQV